MFLWCAFKWLSNINFVLYILTFINSTLNKSWLSNDASLSLLSRFCITISLMKKQKNCFNNFKRYYLMIVIILPIKTFLVKILHNTQQGSRKYNLKIAMVSVSWIFISIYWVIFILPKIVFSTSIGWGNVSEYDKQQQQVKTSSLHSANLYTF